ncbi:tyrosine-protein phosphatase [Corallincola platygyrae]|uniref:Tyrosine-protein phosphatase n=1 Tax=Corallincola platygyrae TaxID=1193278 RepID=A0ABW4XNW8_9GAMM
MTRAEQGKLPVAEVDVHGCVGKIGLHPCPGKRDGSDDYSAMMEQDLQQLLYWGAEAVVTLVEPEELEKHNVADLGDKVVKCDMQWFHLPVPDVGLQDDAFDERWPAVSKRLNALLDGGANVTFHCRGGTGRTGFIAARLMIERGMDKHEVEKLVQAARPGALTMECRREFLGLD